MSVSLQNQAIQPSLFVTHGSSLPLGNALCGLWHKQDSKPALRITQYVVVCNFNAPKPTTICSFFILDFPGLFSACAAAYPRAFSPRRHRIFKVESGINKVHSGLQITIRIVTFSESTFMQLTQGEIRNKEMPFRIADDKNLQGSFEQISPRFL